MKILPLTLLCASTPLIAQTAPELPVPRIPPILIPDIAHKTPAQIAFEQSLPLHLDPASGIRVEPARCEQGSLILGSSTIQRRQGDRATQINSDGVLTVNADGSGSMNTGDTTLRVNADGSGKMTRTLDGVSFTLSVNADGSGRYTGPEGSITADGKGGGTWTGNHGSIRIQPDGSASWTGAQGSITIHADGSGKWVSDSTMQTNHGDGSGSYGVPAQKVAMAPWPPAPKVGSFDLLAPFALPGDVCGYRIILDDRVLFDFDKYHLRPDAVHTLDALGKALAAVKVQSLEVHGHTDSKGSDDYNQTLSEKRAQSVREDLQQRTGIAHISAHGHGESRPVAPNEVDGKDSPANRQLNRRVEIFVKTR